jgi:hypothetical protein
MRRQWEEYLETAGSPAQEEQPPDREVSMAEASTVDESVQSQARENAMAQLDDGASKSKSWLRRVLKR